MQRDLQEVTKPTKIVLIGVTKPTKIVLIEVTKPTKIVKRGLPCPLFHLRGRTKMLKWVSIPEEYLNYLRDNGDKRIPYSDYGKDKYKPFFGVLFTIGNYAYVTQISHPQSRHLTMTEKPDFKKIYDGNRLLCVVNLNYMFPVPISELEYIQYANIEQYRSFKDDDEKSKYIQLLRKELQIINTRNIGVDAKMVYDHKYLYPKSNLANRCIDFRMLENLADQYKK